MGFKGISISSLLLVLTVVLLVFGTKRLRTIGEDLGRAVKSFRKGLECTDEENKGDAIKMDSEDKK